MSIFVFGAGGHAKAVVGTLLELEAVVEGLFDDRLDMCGREVLGAKVLGSVAEGMKKKGEVGIIAVGDNLTRSKLAGLLKGWECMTAVHPKAWVHNTAKLGPGTVVFAGAIIQPDVRVGAHCIVNTGATIDHDCVLGDFVHVAPGSHLGGNVFLEEGALIGIGGIVIPGKRIGKWSVVGAGSVVIDNVPRCSVVAGVPAKIIREPINAKKL